MQGALTPLQAELYALTHRGNPGDVEFYARACANAESVLELGVGYGRLLPALSRASRSLVGLDHDPALLAAARRAAKALPDAQRRRVMLLRGDMQSFDLRRKFARIVLPYNGLYCLPTQRALLACLRCVREHLLPNGEFLLDVWAADRFHRKSGAKGYRYQDDELPLVGIRCGAQSWDVFESSRLQRAQQRLQILYTYVAQGRRARVTIPIAQRYARSSELFELLRRAGLELCRAEGGFAGQRFGASSELLVLSARARESCPAPAARDRGEIRARGAPRRNPVQEMPTSGALSPKGQDKRGQSS